MKTEQNRAKVMAIILRASVKAIREARDVDTALASIDAVTEELENVAGSTLAHSSEHSVNGTSAISGGEEQAARVSGREPSTST